MCLGTYPFLCPLNVCPFDGKGIVISIMQLLDKMGILEEGVLFEWESDSIPRLDVREVFHIHLERRELRSWPKEIKGSAALTYKSYLFQKR